MDEFRDKYSDVSERQIIEAAKAAGDVNGGIRQVRDLIVRNILSKGDHTGELEVPGLVKNDPQALIDKPDKKNEFIYKAGETILTQGEEGDRVHILHEGKVEVFVLSKNETKAVWAATLSSPDVFGEMSAFYGGKRQATVVASTDVKVHKMTLDEWIEFLDSITTDDQMYFENLTSDRATSLVINKWNLDVEFPSLKDLASKTEDWEGYSQDQLTEWGEEVYSTLDTYMKSFTKEDMVDNVLAAYLRSGDYTEVRHVHEQHFGLIRSGIRGTFSGVRKKIFDWTHKSKLDRAIAALSRRSDAPWIGEIKRAAYYTRNSLIEILSDTASIPDGTSVDAADALMTERAKEILTRFYQLVNTYVDQELITSSYATLVKGRTVPWIRTDFRELGGFVEENKFSHDAILDEFTE